MTTSHWVVMCHMENNFPAAFHYQQLAVFFCVRMSRLTRYNMSLVITKCEVVSVPSGRTVWPSVFITWSKAECIIHGVNYWNWAGLLWVSNYGLKGGKNHIKHWNLWYNFWFLIVWLYKCQYTVYILEIQGQLIVCFSSLFFLSVCRWIP